MEMTNARWEFTNRYARDVFGEEDDVLTRLVRDASEEGLPTWAVSADVGQLLKILTSMTRGRLALEIGTLGGYSTIWLAQGMAVDGRLITIEKDDRHADFAERQFASAGLGVRIEMRRGAALDVLPDIAEEVGPASLDVVFVDADKTEYLAYYEAVRPLVSPGGLLIVDNALGTGSTWVDDLSGPGITTTDAMNRAIAADPRFTATVLPVREGVLVARRK